MTDLIQAGGNGVVVKAVFSGPGLTSTMNLVGVDMKTPAVSLFQVPSWYSLIDNTNFTMP